MQIELNGKTAIVTGSTKGIGLASATELAIAGATVVINGRTHESVDRAIEHIREAAPGAEVRGVAADLAEAAGCTLLVEKEPECDILVNNLGIFEIMDFFETQDADWQRYFDTNVMSGIRLARAYMPRMQEKDWGRVVFLSSESGLNIPAEMIQYGFTKTAVLSISRGLAKRMAGTGVTVNAVLPGPTLSDGVAGMLAEDAEERGVSLEQAGRDFVAEKRPSSIIRRPASVQEVANMIVYTCSKQASATTGAALRVDGGVVDSIA